MSNSTSCRYWQVYTRRTLLPYSGRMSTMTWLKAIPCAHGLTHRNFCINTCLQNTTRKPVSCSVQKQSAHKGNEEEKQGLGDRFIVPFDNPQLFLEYSFSFLPPITLRSVCFSRFLLQVRVTREGRSAYLHPPSEDGTLQGSATRSCGQIWHGDSLGGRHGRQPQSAR